MKLYLTAYNLVQAVGWYYVFGRTAGHLLTGGHHEQTWQLVASVVVALQWASCLEVVHVALGLVPGGLLPSLAQVVGRNHLLLVALQPIHEVHTHWLVTALFLSWSAIELVRYPFYALSLWHKCPYVLEWLRYTLFIPLYPIGFSVELGLYWVLLPYINAHGLYRLSMPNKWNFAFDYAYFVVAFAVVAIAFFPQNYSYMFLQRKKKISSSPPKAIRSK